MALGRTPGSAADSVTSVAGRTGTVVLTKADVGLSNVDNVSDANKPVSAATQTALNLKASLASPIFTGTLTTPNLTVAGGNLSTTYFVPPGNTGAYIQMDPIGGIVVNARSDPAYVPITVFGMAAQSGDLQQWKSNVGALLASIGPTGHFFITNQVAPATPTGGGVLYCDGGALKFKGSGGTVTTLGAA